MKRFALTVLSAIAVAGLWACASGNSSATARSESTAQPSIPLPAVSDDTPRDYPGIHNAVAYHEDFVSGSAPEGDEGFATLAAMGIKTIISVDGAVPEVERARSHGIRYIHLPIGYNGFDDERKLQLVRATRDALRDGPVYIHCHHGKHRSAGAAATIVASLGWSTPEQATARMHISGTAPSYEGLYACAGGATILTASLIDSVPANFPSIWTPSGYVKGMIEIDDAFEHLKLIEAAGWATPADSPDLVPAAEAGRLADLFRFLADTDYVAHTPPELASMMRAAEARAQTLEDLLVAAETDAVKRSAQFKLIAASCKDCHAKFRD